MLSDSMKRARTCAVCASIAVMTLAASGARASIVYQDIPDIHMVWDPSVLYGNVSRTLDLNGDQVDDLSLGVSWNYFGGQQANSTGVQTFAGAATANGVPLFWVFPQRLDAGSIIGPAWDPWGNGGALATNNKGGHGIWGGNGYLGVRLPEAGGVMYGWVFMSADLYHVDVYSYAYETDINTPIAAGAVPAPGAGMVLIGSLAGCGLRRRRNCAVVQGVEA